MPSINHIGVYVADLNGTKEFYETYFGAVAGELYHNPTKGFKSYFLTFPNGGRLEIMTKDGIEGNNSMGKCHVSFSVGGKEQVDALTNRLKNDGYEVLDGPRTTGDGFYESQVADISGNIIEITE